MKMETVPNWFHSLPIAGIKNKVLTMLWANDGLKYPWWDVKVNLHPLEEDELVLAVDESNQ